MTNYMELLMTNQPWNLIFFMVIPVSLAEGLVATEFYTLHQRNDTKSPWQTLNRVLGIAAGIYFTLVFLFLLTHVIPNIEWRGWADIIAIVAYLCGVAPLLSITLMEFGLLGKNFSKSQRTHAHFLLLISFLVVSHVAMIFGMVDPVVTGWNPAAHHEMNVHEHAHSSTMHAH